MEECKPLTVGAADRAPHPPPTGIIQPAAVLCHLRATQGWAVQVDPINLTLKPRGTKRLKLKREILLSTSAFKFNLRRYGKVYDVFFAPWAKGRGKGADPVDMRRWETYVLKLSVKGHWYVSGDHHQKTLDYNVIWAGAYTRPPFSST